MYNLYTTRSDSLILKPYNSILLFLVDLEHHGRGHHDGGQKSYKENLTKSIKHLFS